MTFPAVRMRRLRQSPALRALTVETRLHPAQFVFPIFVHEHSTDRTPIPSMPGQDRWPVGMLPGLARDLRSRGIRAVLLFGLPAHKDEVGSGAYRDDGIVQRATRTLKESDPELLVMTDTCLDEYTSHGHCGVVIDGQVDNDATLELLAQTAVSQAAAGADIVAPSDMMDGRVGALRGALDSEGYGQTPIMAYSVKYASSFYGPFREAADCAPRFGDRRSYQMDPANAREALREVDLDIQEGADIILVKPALPYLDIIRDLRRQINHPIAAYNVSGEYSMVKAAAANGWLDEKLVVLETLTSVARAGADIIITYHAREAAAWLESGD